MKLFPKAIAWCGVVIHAFGSSQYNCSVISAVLKTRSRRSQSRFGRNGHPRHSHGIAGSAPVVSLVTHEGPLVPPAIRGYAEAL